MSYNGSGTFVINTAGQPVVSGTVISSTAFNALTADLATGLSTAITKDGQTTPTANIPMGNNKITGLAVGTAATDAANLSQVQSTAAKLVNSVSGADTITGTMSPNLGAYATGQMFYFVAVGANTGAVTINIDSLGAKSITRDGTTALAAGDIQSGEVCVIVYDGTQFQLVNGASQSASIVTENLTVNKATVLNESGGDNDTRIEGDTDANLFFADASTDRIGIGTNAPTQKLTVAAAGKIEVLRSDNARGGQLFADSLGTHLVALAAGNDPLFLETLGSDGIRFLTSASEKMRLSGSGNLGLGVTPAGWTTYKAMQFSTTGAIAAASGGDMVVGNNYYYDGANKYLTTAPATYYYQYNGAHSWHTAASGTAGNTITFTQAMTLDASGNLGVGTTTAPGANGGGIAIYKSDYPRLTFRNSTSGDGTGDGLQMALVGSDFTYDLVESGYQRWTTGGSERARITSGGEFLLGTATAGDGFFRVSASANAYNIIKIDDTGSTGGNYIQFLNSAGNQAGSINHNGTTTVNYGSGSDYRLKENIAPMTGALAKVALLKPCTFTWKTDGTNGQGFIAHELQEVVPDAVVGKKDEVNEDGSIKTQTVDTSFLVATLTAAIQELKAELDATKAEVAALKGA